MSEHRQLGRYITHNDALLLWGVRYRERAEAEPEAGAPDPRKVTYVGVMSESYAPSGDQAFVPVDSAAELFSRVPPDYSYVGSQILARHADTGTMALPFRWSSFHTSISGLAYGMIRVLVAFVLSQLDDASYPVEPNADMSKVDADVVRRLLPHEVSAEPARLYEVLCELFGEMHNAYYGDYPGKLTSVIPGILRRNRLVAEAVAESVTGDGKKALQILLKLGGEWDRTWVAGLRELGEQVMLREQGIFAGKEMVLWFLGIQEEFEFASRREMAGYVWMQEREKERSAKED